MFTFLKNVRRITFSSLVKVEVQNTPAIENIREPLGKNKNDLHEKYSLFVTYRIQVLFRYLFNWDGFVSIFSESAWDKFGFHIHTSKVPKSARKG